MKKILAVLIFIVIKSGIAFTQDTIFILHPSVGATIDKNEKLNYLLFPEIKDTCFQYCFIKPLKGRFAIYSFFRNDSLSISKVDTLELVNYQTNISKLDEYFSNQSKPDSLKSTDQVKKDNQTMKYDILSPNTIKDIKNETRRDARLKDDEERMNRYRKGNELAPVDIYLFDLFSKKKK